MNGRPRTLRQAAATALAIDAATVEAVAALEAESVPCVLLKGPALLDLLYERGEERSWDDADLLVPADLEPRASEALKGIGFRPRLADPLERSSGALAIHLVRPGGSAGTHWESVDLHTGFVGVEASPEIFWRSIWAGRSSIELFGRSVPVPSVPARLALVALHAGSHGAGHARSLRDLTRALVRFGSGPWSAALELAREWQAVDSFLAGAALDPSGRRLLVTLGVAGDRPSARARMRAAGAPRGLRPLEQLARAEGVRTRLGLIRRRLFPSRQLMLTWKPIARRSRLGLAVAYAWRPAWVAWQLVVAAVAYVRVRLR